MPHPPVVSPGAWSLVLHGMPLYVLPGASIVWLLLTLGECDLQVNTGQVEPRDEALLKELPIVAGSYVWQL